MHKKVNIQKFLSKFTQNSLLVQLFKMHEVKTIPNILDGKNDEKVSNEWFEFYKSLDLEIRENINESMENINILCSKDSYNIYKEYISKVNPTANEVIAFSFHDKALAFYIDHFEKFEDVIFVISFYKKILGKDLKRKGRLK